MKIDCGTCYWFQMNTGKPHNRYCQYPGKIAVKDGYCARWKDPRSLWQKLTRKRIPLRSFIK